jgi:multiple antibiotic resistance protein
VKARAEEVKSAADAAGKPMEDEDISVFPMAIPMLAGPGSIATVICFRAHRQSGAETVWCSAR